MYRYYSYLACPQVDEDLWMGIHPQEIKAFWVSQVLGRIKATTGRKQTDGSLRAYLDASGEVLALITALEHLDSRGWVREEWSACEAELSADVESVMGKWLKGLGEVGLVPWEFEGSLSLAESAPFSSVPVMERLGRADVNKEVYWRRHVEGRLSRTLGAYDEVDAVCRRDGVRAGMVYLKLLKRDLLELYYLDGVVRIPGKRLDDARRSVGKCDGLIERWLKDEPIKVGKKKKIVLW